MYNITECQMFDTRWLIDLVGTLSFVLFCLHVFAKEIKKINKGYYLNKKIVYSSSFIIRTLVCL